jgi:two-component system KDP operon response regulator KdpE|tara:strand:- start:319 stop:1029 length:711 start_codon:yes stop_codon:yes gene_type:complete
MPTTNEPISVLAIDDDPKILRLIANHLGGIGFKVLLASNGNEAIYQASLHHPQVIVLDLIMPQMDGFETLTRLREWYTDPVIILSATDQEEEKITALDLGADDYVTKPFGSGELAARIRAAVRRVDRLGDTRDAKEPKIDAGTFEIDLAARVVYKNDQEIRLTRTEYDLLRVLAVNAGKVMTHRQLLQAVWGPDYGEETEYLRTFVKQIRRKLEKDPTRPKNILTEPGVGYRLVIR